VFVTVKMSVKLFVRNAVGCASGASSASRPIAHTGAGAWRAAAPVHCARAIIGTASTPWRSAVTASTNRFCLTSTLLSAR